MFFFILEARCPIFENVKLEVNLEASGNAVFHLHLMQSIALFAFGQKRTNFRRRRDLEIE
jgi:hypothetical protein